MKHFKTIIILFVFFNLSGQIIAQTSIGFQAGLNLSKLVNNYEGGSETTNRLPAFTGGIPFEFKITEIFSLQPELTYITKGGKTVETDGNDVYKYSVKFNYLEIPVYGKFSVGSPKIKLDMFAGPSIAIGLSANQTSTIIENGEKHSITEKLDFKDDKINRIDVSLNIGAGTALAVGSNRLFFNIIYREGLTNISTEEQSSQPENQYSVNNNNILFTVGLMTPLAAKKAKQPLLKVK